MIVVIYDDTGRKSEIIADIIGDKGFADVVVKKRRLEEYYKDAMKRIYPDLHWRKVSSVFEYADLERELEGYRGSDVRIMHCFSNYLISDENNAALSFKKLSHVDEPYGVMDGKRAVAAMFPDAGSYRLFFQDIISGQKPWDAVKEIKEAFQIDGLVDIGIIGNFIQCITGNFDSRYFNTLKGNEYTLVKSSANKSKIRAEYNFYHLLPDNMKFWFVMPFDYKEEENQASYTMERLHMADLAVKWVHGSIDATEFENLMDKYFYFFRSRHSKPCSREEYLGKASDLYVDKVRDRVENLKTLPEYGKIKSMLAAEEGLDIDLLLNRYLELKEKVEATSDYKNELVIGHGDPCFANALYSKATRTLKFIDPKGADSEEELWTHPYYDIAKLSHSVCGRYDFFNNALFDIKVDNNFSFVLEIPFDNTKYIEIFKKKVEENGFDYLSVRVYEISLFLSMLPLHIDNPHKVFGFILNVKNMLEEVEKDV